MNVLEKIVDKLTKLVGTDTTEDLQFALLGMEDEHASLSERAPQFIGPRIGVDFKTNQPKYHVPMRPLGGSVGYVIDGEEPVMFQNKSMYQPVYDSWR
jgi:hypothetical protein